MNYKKLMNFFTIKSKLKGLGLSISYSIIDRHREVLEINSKVVVETTVIINLPILAQSSP